MKISKVIELDVGSSVPLILAEIVDVKEKKENGTQVIDIKDDTGEIKIQFSNRDLITKACIGKSVSIESGKSPKGLVDGLSLAESKNKILFVKANNNVKIREIKEVEEEPEKAEQPKEEVSDEPSNPVDKSIRKRFKERLYIYKHLLSLNEEEDIKYPDGKLTELATSIYIDLSREGIDILPKKSTPRFPDKAEKKEVKKSEDEATDLWRYIPHPTDKEKLLGSFSDSEIKQKFGALYYRMMHKIPEMEEDKKRFYIGVGLALKEFKYKPSNALADYVTSYNPKLNTQILAIKRINAYLVSEGIMADQVNDSMIIKIMCDKDKVQKIASGDFERKIS